MCCEYSTRLCFRILVKSAYLRTMWMQFDSVMLQLTATVLNPPPSWFLSSNSKTVETRRGKDSPSTRATFCHRISRRPLHLTRNPFRSIAFSPLTNPPSSASTSSSAALVSSFSCRLHLRCHCADPSQMGLTEHHRLPSPQIKHSSTAFQLFRFVCLRIPPCCFCTTADGVDGIVRITVSPVCFIGKHGPTSSLIASGSSRCDASFE